MKTSTVAPILLAAALGLAGCSGKPTTTEASTPSATAAETTISETTTSESPMATETKTASPTEDATTGSTGTETPGSDTGMIDPNTASEEEIASRLEQAGVPDAATWAKRIKENGPYTAENAASKVQELAKKYPMDLTTINEIRRALGF